MMKGVRDWVFSHIMSKSLVSPTPLSGSDGFYDGERHREDFNAQGTMPDFTVCVELLEMNIR